MSTTTIARQTCKYPGCKQPAALSRDTHVGPLPVSAAYSPFRGMQLAGVMQVSAVATDAVRGAVLGF